ncbi:MAG: hypothetical protein HC788_12945 [Sphingopyxis sp.]|nr:hypothetical protein [Sphingopyxis sp.]
MCKESTAVRACQDTREIENFVIENICLDGNKANNANLDGNNDGRIDTVNDPEGDGIANNVDTQDAAFGGLPAPTAPPAPVITSPANGSIYALDPDIPGDRQRLSIRVSGAAAGHRLLLGKAVLGDAEAGAEIVPRPGSHLVSLVDPGGRTIDRIRFTVR